MKLQNEALIKGAQLKRSQPPAQSNILVGHLQLRNRSSRSSSIASDDSQNSADCQSRASSQRREIQIHDASDKNRFQILKCKIRSGQQTEMRIEDMNNGSKGHGIGNHLKPRNRGPPE